MKHDKMEHMLMNTKILDGKVAIVTGARQGIGKAEALALASEGAKIVACDLNDDLTSLKDEIIAVGSECLALKCDVTQKDEIQNVVTQTIEKFGKIDILVNNAQAGLEPVPWENLTDELVALSLNSGPVASWRFMQACFPYMKAQGWGRIINTASGASRGGVSNFGHYAMAKGAIASLTYAAATDWSKFGITINVIFPAILTDSLKSWIDGSPERRRSMEATIPVGFVGEPSRDLGPVVVFLASDASRYMTGHPFFIDGGGARAPR
jgi:NAD(P)-dependent dehydrogenase (short-subunit alcohol dehydrogenase family)